MASIGAMALVAVAAMTTTANAANDNSTYTLYRNPLVEGILRIHVASFDTDSGVAYNQENCLLAAVLFNSQPGVKAKFWCERGRFKP